MFRSEVLLFLLIALTPALGFAQSQRPVAVIALDDNAGSKKTATRMAEVLVTGDREVVYGDQVFAKIGEARVEISPDTAKEFAGISERVAKGVKSFFYEGYDTAIDQLAPILQLGIKRFAYVAKRPDIAAQIYEAGLVLLRAYQGRKQLEDAKATARILVQYFPAREPSLDSSPPEVIEMVREARKSVEADQAMLGIKPLGDGTCQAFLNGSRVADGFFPVGANKPAFVQVECDGERGPLWKVVLPAKARVIAPVPLHRIDSLVMPDDSFKSRRAAESIMTAIQFWGGFDEVVGIRHPESEGDAPTLFGHLKAGGVTWTETNDVPALVGFVQRTFNVESDQAYAALKQSDAAPGKPIDWLSWTLTGGGAAGIAGGIVLIALGNSHATEIICSGYATEQPSAGQCDGVDNLGALTRAEFDDEVASADLKMVGGYTLVGIGTAALGYGIYRLITGEESGATVFIVPNGNNVHAELSFRF